jgi:hypothetical protein
VEEQHEKRNEAQWFQQTLEALRRRAMASNASLLCLSPLYTLLHLSKRSSSCDVYFAAASTGHPPQLLSCCSDGSAACFNAAVTASSPTFTIHC